MAATNNVRFGPVLEFGYRYQLALIDLHRNYNSVFGPAFIIPNLFNYLVYPFVVRAEFPFFLPKHGDALDLLLSRLLPLCRTETITGLLLSSPVMLYSARPAVVEIAELRKHGLRLRFKERNEEPIHWRRWIAIGTILANLPVLHPFFHSAPRYLMAILPMTTVLTVLGPWRALVFRSSQLLKRKVNIIIAAALSIWSVLATLLLAISSAQGRFLNGNPAMIQRINRLFFGP